MSRALWSSLLRWHQTFRLRDRVLYGSVVISAGLLIIIFYLALVPRQLLRLSRHPLPVATVAFRGDRALVYRLDYCTSSDRRPVVVLHTLHAETGQILTLATAGLALAAGCDEAVIVVPIPAYVPPGRYTMQLIYTSRTNAVTVPPFFETESFELP
jgi:hypothetical protein